MSRTVGSVSLCFVSHVCVRVCPWWAHYHCCGRSTCALFGVLLLVWSLVYGSVLVVYLCFPRLEFVFIPWIHLRLARFFLCTSIFYSFDSLPALPVQSVYFAYVSSFPSFFPPLSFLFYSIIYCMYFSTLSSFDIRLRLFQLAEFPV